LKGGQSELPCCGAKYQILNTWCAKHFGQVKLSQIYC
jgi:hypothetical protein